MNWSIKAEVQDMQATLIIMAPCSLLGLCWSPNSKITFHDMQFLGSDVMNSSQARQQRIDEVVSTYQRHPGDSGSSEVQGMVQISLQR